MDAAHSGGPAAAARPSLRPPLLAPLDGPITRQGRLAVCTLYVPSYAAAMGSVRKDPSAPPHPGIWRYRCALSDW